MRIIKGLYYSLLIMGCILVSNGITVFILGDQFKLTKILWLIPAGLVIVAIAKWLKRKYKLNNID